MSESEPAPTIEQLELHFSERVLYCIEPNGKKHRVALGSVQRLGLISYLIAARLTPGDEGWRSDVDILAEAPGQDRKQALRSVGKRIWDLCTDFKCFKGALDDSEQTTVGPWCILVEPSKIVIKDSEALQRFLEAPRVTRSHVTMRSPRGRAHDRAKQKAIISNEHDLKELEVWIERGVMAAFKQGLLEQLMASPKRAIRAQAQRIDAMRLRRLGKLLAAQKRIGNALRLLKELKSAPALELAAAHDEAGAIAYHLNQMEQALEYIQQEIVLLESVEDAAARAQGLARAKRWIAFIELRLEHPEAAKLAAEEALRFATDSGDPAERVLADLARLRVLAHTGFAQEAAHQLHQVTLDAPASHPVVNLMARRFYAEALFALGQTERADQVALNVFTDAKRLGLAREADAARNMLRWNHRDDALRKVQPGDRAIKRDQLDDLALVLRAASGGERQFLL